MAVISREQWEQWAKDDVTLAFREYLKNTAKDAMVAWAAGEFIPGDRSLDQVGAINIAAVEKVKTLYAVAELDYDDYLTIAKEIGE